MERVTNSKSIFVEGYFNFGSECVLFYRFQVPVRPSPGSAQRADNNSTSFSLGLIVGLPASLLAVVVFVSVLVYRHRRINLYRGNHSSRTNSEKGKATVIMSSQTNSGYQLDDNSAYEEVEVTKPRK